MILLRTEMNGYWREYGAVIHSTVTFGELGDCPARLKIYSGNSALSLTRERVPFWSRYKNDYKVQLCGVIGLLALNIRQP